MKKFFTFFAVALMALATQANVLTVCESTDDDYVSSSTPVYGWWFDEAGYSQLIYPADMLADMAGGEITELTFYTPAGGWGAGYEQYAINFYGADVTLALKEVDVDNFGDADYPSPVAGATVVATVTPERNGMYLTFTLSEPFQYNGGNLLVECSWDGTGQYGDTYFVGVSDFGRNTVYVGFDYWGDWEEGAFDFLPMLTFTYTPGEVGPIDPPVYPTEKTDAPSSTKENYVYNDGNLYYNAYIVNLIETEPSTIYYRVGILVDGDYVYGDWMLYTGELNFTEEGTYMIEAYAIAENKLESDHIWDGFTVSKMVDVEELFAGKTVANVRYFNLAGQEMQQANGLTIMVTTFTDGTTSAVKVVK